MGPTCVPPFYWKLFCFVWWLRFKVQESNNMAHPAGPASATDRIFDTLFFLLTYREFKHNSIIVKCQRMSQGDLVRFFGLLVPHLQEMKRNSTQVGWNQSACSCGPSLVSSCHNKKERQRKEEERNAFLTTESHMGTSSDFRIFSVMHSKQTKGEKEEGNTCFQGNSGLFVPNKLRGFWD